MTLTQGNAGYVKITHSKPRDEGLKPSNDIAKGNVRVASNKRLKSPEYLSWKL